MTLPFTKTDKRSRILGAALAVAVLLICCIWYSWMDGLLFAAMYLAVGFVRLRVRHPISQFLVNALWGIVCIFACCWIASSMVGGSAYLSIGHFRVVMNFVCAAIVFGICLSVTGEIKSAVAIASILLLFLSTANAFVFQFRGNLLRPMDILAVGTALNVAGQYVYRLHQQMAYGLILGLWLVFCLRCLPPADQWIPRRWLRPAAAAASLLCIAVFWQSTKDVTMYTWSNEGATRNGYLLNFAVGFRDFFIDKPENYSSDTIRELEEAYAVESDAAGEKELPNILVIMNESFADSSILGSELRTNQPVTPFIDSLTENTIRGYALTSIFGGTTANAEFEFLTSHSMANMPTGSCPYEQYISRDTYSLARLLNQYGYKTFSTHPYFSSGWNRVNVYSHFGFSESTFAESYPYQDLVREFVSDREMYDYVLDTLDAEQDAPLFLFGITMQNHGDYTYSGPNYQQTISLEGYQMELPMAEQHLSLLHESDSAVQYLLSELEEYPEDTIVLFFGDHFPQVEGDFFQEVHGGPFETLSEQMLQYTVPFFLWANFDIPEQTVECTSLNYLARYVLEAAGLELPPYYRFLKEMEQAIPSINALGYYSQSQQTYLPLNQASGEEAQWLNRYAILQYNALFDPNNLSEIFWKQYLHS